MDIYSIILTVTHLYYMSCGVYIQYYLIFKNLHIEKRLDELYTGWCLSSGAFTSSFSAF